MLVLATGFILGIERECIKHIILIVNDTGIFGQAITCIMCCIATYRMHRQHTTLSEHTRWTFQIARARAR